MNLLEFVKANPEKTLKEVRDAIITIDKKKVGSGQARGFFVDTNDIWRKLRVIQADFSHPLFPLADAIIVTASDANSYFGLDPKTSDGLGNILGANALVTANIMTIEHLNEFLGKSISTMTPFYDLTLLQYNQAKQIFTEKKVTDYVPGKNIKITLIDDLPENCAATTWVNNEFGKENFAKVAHLNTKTTMYKIRTDNKKADGELFVRIPFANFNFSVECI